LSEKLALKCYKVGIKLTPSITVLEAAI